MTALKKSYLQLVDTLKDKIHHSDVADVKSLEKNFDIQKLAEKIDFSPIVRSLQKRSHRRRYAGVALGAAAGIGVLYILRARAAERARLKSTESSLSSWEENSDEETNSWDAPKASNGKNKSRSEVKAH